MTLNEDKPDKSKAVQPCPACQGTPPDADGFRLFDGDLLAIEEERDFRAFGIYAHFLQPPGEKAQPADHFATIYLGGLPEFYLSVFSRHSPHLLFVKKARASGPQYP